MSSPRDIPALLAFLASRAAMPHAWGRDANDCVAFCDGAVKAQGGEDKLGGLNWSTLAGALRVLKRLGGMEAAIDARFARIAPAKALRGDIAGVRDALFGIKPMLVEGDTLVSPGQRGFARLPRAAMVTAWSAVDHV